MAPPLEIGPGQRFWTIQRVNGNGGNGKGDGVAGPHRHTLAKSDEIKKSSVQRYLATQERETKKKGPKPPAQRRATGAALTTIKRHSKDSDLKLYAACFCPYSQRVWIALEAKGITYQYHEVDPYRRPLSTQLLEANPPSQPEICDACGGALEQRADDSEEVVSRRLRSRRAGVRRAFPTGGRGKQSRIAWIHVCLLPRSCFTPVPGDGTSPKRSFHP
jgi:glutaredoxin